MLGPPGKDEAKVSDTSVSTLDGGEIEPAAVVWLCNEAVPPIDLTGLRGSCRLISLTAPQAKLPETLVFPGMPPESDGFVPWAVQWTFESYLIQYPGKLGDSWGLGSISRVSLSNPGWTKASVRNGKFLLGYPSDDESGEDRRNKLLNVSPLNAVSL